MTRSEIPCPTVYPTVTTGYANKPDVTRHNVPCEGRLYPCDICGKTTYCSREHKCLHSQEPTHLQRRRFTIEYEAYTDDCPTCHGQRDFKTVKASELAVDDLTDWGYVTEVKPGVPGYVNVATSGEETAGPYTNVLPADLAVQVQFEMDECPHCKGTNKVGMPGWTRGETWNGWACPLFERAEVDRIIAENEGSDMTITFDEATQTVRCHQPDLTDEEQEVWEAQIIANPDAADDDNDFRTVWAIGAGYWIWTADEYGPLVFK